MTKEVKDIIADMFQTKDAPMIFGADKKERSNTFARLFETLNFGQILVVLQRGEQGNPELQWSIKPDGFDVCTVNFTYQDTDAAWDTVQELLESFTMKDALKIADEMMVQINKMSD